jgi:alcohol dehydrogenase
MVRDRYEALLGTPKRRAKDDDPSETLAVRLEDLASMGNLALKLGDTGVEASAIPELAELAAQQWTGTFNPRPFSAAAAADLYRAAF